jgi:hypothetical protein
MEIYGNIWKYIDISWHIMTCRKHEELSIEMGDLCRWMVRVHGTKGSTLRVPSFPLLT